VVLVTRAGRPNEPFDLLLSSITPHTAHGHIPVWFDRVIEPMLALVHWLVVGFAFEPFFLLLIIKVLAQPNITDFDCQIS
jgi:hypothetical protein